MHVKEYIHVLTDLFYSIVSLTCDVPGEIKSEKSWHVAANENYDV